MILPTKRLSPSRSLIVVGAEIIRLLDEPKTVSRLWHDLKQERAKKGGISLLTYDWFVLTLDFLCALDGIELQHGRLRRVQQ